MADETASAAPADVPAAAPTVEHAEPNDKPVSAQTNGDATATQNSDDLTAAESTEPVQSAGEDEKVQDADPTSAEAPSEATPSSGGRDKKRKSTGGVPEHKNKNKKLTKKKSMPTLHLECKPGEFYWARLKGYPPWPSVVCDEEMLPESLLATRPVSTTRPDGSIRDDFKAGGKNAKERTFPIMFLHTNEFQWMVNTNLTPLDPEECKNVPQSKMAKSLQIAYQVAAENHELDYFKTILRDFQEEEDEFQRQQLEAAAEAERLAAEQADKAAQEAAENGSGKPKKKKAPRKSKGADDDVDMVDAEAPKSSKKRKKDAESDADAPKKTPKITKLNAPKTPNGEASASKKSSSKPKKKVVTAPKAEEADESKPQLTEAEKLQQREKAVLYLRHRLQKGFLARDQAPQESEMAGMAEFFGQLEAYEDLEPQIIRATKIHKVLKAIIKLASIPKDAEYDFKKRSSALLEVWNKRMEADGDAAPQSAVDIKPRESKTGPVKENGEQEVTKEASSEPTIETKDAEMKEAISASNGGENPTEAKATNDVDKDEQIIEKADNVADGAGAPTKKATDASNGSQVGKEATDVE